ncbi:hypothetical protein NC796_21960 [Aliifodinibius sp. S!AR15-10]|uniref:hypothetical protein n=1 Tax=Aliifodinibius sp. S!AR15-10 TaxID=2950437 RepID=UPI002854A03D|nr:hypothetical protein [Aliifodinibius sp. S!AR15-10]MDR8393834.1 hypothetical protein [Aliifodinibius sp. S!AR15-10]
MPVAIVNKNEKIIHDSLSILQTPNIIAEFGPRSMRIIGMSPYQPADRFKVLGNGKYAIARADSAELQFYSANDELQHRLSLNIEERPVTGENVEFLLDKKNLEGDDRKKMEARIPETKPPFLNAWITKSHI